MKGTSKDLFSLASGLLTVWGALRKTGNIAPYARSFVPCQLKAVIAFITQAICKDPLKSSCWIVLVILFVGNVSWGLPPQKRADLESQLGINLAGPSDWNTEQPLVNVFYFSRPWISQQLNQPWGKGPDLALDEHGWVKALEPNCWAQSIVCNINGGHYPSGNYTLIYDGQGELEPWGAKTELIRRESGREIWHIDSSKGGLHIKLTQTNPQDYLRNLRVIMPNCESTSTDQPWQKNFLDRWQGMSCLRFMDFMHTNGSAVKHWQDRPTLKDASFSRKGIPLELMIDLCNQLNADPWFCMPHAADDDFIRRFAQMTAERLNPDRKVYIEYSNEVWNGIFAQNRYASSKGLSLKLSDKPWEAAWYYTALRSLEIFAIWQDVFGGHDRLVRILPTQSANPEVAKRLLSFHNAGHQVDALAIAPYLSFIVSPNSKNLDLKTVRNWSVDQAMDYMEQQALPKTIGDIEANKKLADQYGLALIAYEAGQHMVGIQGGENDPKLTELFIACNQHPRMGALYDQYYAAWHDHGGALICAFSSVSRPSKWGCWGLLKTMDEAAEQSPKYAATHRWMTRWHRQKD